MKIQRMQHLFFGGIVGMFALWFCGIILALASGCGTPEVAQVASRRAPPPTEHIGAATATSPFSTVTDDSPQWRWGPVLFYTNRHNIRFDQLHSLDEQAEFLIANRNLYVHVNGHADERGGRLGNALLARRRAEAVHDYLVRCGVREKQIIVFSFGEDRVTGGDDRSNRRAEIELQ